MVTINEFHSGRILRKATKKEYERYKKKISKMSREDQMSGEVPGKPYGFRFLIYMQDYPIGGFDDEN